MSHPDPCFRAHLLGEVVVSEVARQQQAHMYNSVVVRLMEAPSPLDVSLCCPVCVCVSVCDTVLLSWKHQAIPIIKVVCLFLLYVCISYYWSVFGVCLFVCFCWLSVVVVLISSLTLCKVDHAKKYVKCKYLKMRYMSKWTFKQKQKAPRRQVRARDQTYSAGLRRPMGHMGPFKNLLPALWSLYQSADYSIISCVCWKAKKTSCSWSFKYGFVSAENFVNETDDDL